MTTSGLAFVYCV